MNAVAAQTAPMWKSGSEEAYPEVLSADKLCEILLSPHGNSLCGLQHGAWTLEEDEGKCSCMEMEVDSPKELTSHTTSSTKIVDITTDTIDASDAPQGAHDVRGLQREGIKITLRVPKYPKKNKNKKKKPQQSSSPPPQSSVPSAPPATKPVPSNPGTSSSSKHDPPAPPAIKKSKKAGSKNSQVAQTPNPTQKSKSLPKIPKVPQPSAAPPQPKPRKVLLPSPTPATPNKPSSDTPSATPSKNTASANNNVSDNEVPVKDKEPSSESRGNPQSWGMWWCWISDCGLVNYMPQDWCSHCGHSKHAKQGNVHLNNLKRKLAKISGGAD